MKTSTKHAYDLSIPIYLKYLHSNIQSYNVILGFLAGENWWQLLTDLYNGPYATKFFGYLENSFEVAEDLLSNFDDIHVSSKKGNKYFKSFYMILSIIYSNN